MGSGASILSVTLAENPNFLEIYRKEFAELFAEEYSRLRSLGLSEEEIKQQFLLTLKENEQSIIQKIAKAEQQRQHNGGTRDSEDNANTAENYDILCSKAVESIINKGSHTFLCCIDGSPASNVAYELCYALMKKHDSICLFHAFCESNFPNLPSTDYLPTEIRKKYEAKLKNSLIIPSHYSFHFEECYTRSVLRVLTDLIDHHSDNDKRFVLPSAAKSPDFVILGQAGLGSDYHHEDESHPAKRDPQSLGRTSDMALRSTHLPCIIAKKVCSKEGIRTFVLAVNYTDQSKRGLDILLRLVSSRDTLELIYIHKPEVSIEKFNQIKQYYEEELQRYGPQDSRFLKISIDHSQNVADTIIDYVNNSNRIPDFFAISPRATVVNQAHSKLTEKLIKEVNTSIILCKN